MPIKNNSSIPSTLKKKKKKKLFPSFSFSFNKTTTLLIKRCISSEARVKKSGKAYPQMYWPYKEQKPFSPAIKVIKGSGTCNLTL